MISNHLATALAALVRWHKRTRETRAEIKANELMQRILNHQSKEGWFCEYEGADPGYQSLCTYYLADVHQNRPDLKLLGPLQRSIDFLNYFAHPDGSFGGLYGSRCTRFYYPAGFLALADEIPEAEVLGNYMAESIARKRVVTLSAMDEPNLIPMFNCYCWAATLYEKQKGTPRTVNAVPAQSATPFQRWFPEAGLLLDRGLDHYTVISTHKGGVVYHFVGNRPVMVDSGVVVQNHNKELGSSQSHSPSNRIERAEKSLKVVSQITAMPKQLPNPWQFIILRLLSLTVFRITTVREWIKQILVRLLITRKQNWRIENIRTIRLGRDLQIDDEIQLPNGYQRKEGFKIFVPIHMASQGYWQIQDEEG